MLHNQPLSRLYTLHYTLTKIIQALLKPIKMMEFEDIFSQLSTTTLMSLKIDGNVLSIDILYDKELAYSLNTIGREICKSNQFEVVLSVEEGKEKMQKILSMDFLHHNLDYLIKAIDNKTANNKTISSKLIKTLEDLEFIVPEKNKEASINSDIERLIAWACKHDISEQRLPRIKEKLLSLEVLNLSNIALHTIPKHIRVLKNLKKLYLTNCQLVQLPLEIFSLENLEILWLQNNYLITLSKEINNLKHLQELIIYDNNIESLPSMHCLKQLSFFCLHSNLLSAEEMDSFLKTIPKSAKVSLYDQREQFPFIIEQLSSTTLKEAEKLRDDTFEDIEEMERDLLRASLDNIQYKKCLENNDITMISYWIARDKFSKKVVGLTGLYTEIDDEENCWLGWFCVDKTYRGKGLGKRLLQFAEEQARFLKKETMHIYTYNSRKYARAIEMYKQFGYSEYAVKNTKYKRDLYFRKEVDNTKRLNK